MRALCVAIVLIAIFIVGIIDEVEASGADIVATAEGRPSNDADIVPILNISEEMDVARFVSLRGIGRFSQPYLRNNWPCQIKWHG